MIRSLSEDALHLVGFCIDVSNLLVCAKQSFVHVCNLSPRHDLPAAGTALRQRLDNLVTLARSLKTDADKVQSEMQARLKEVSEVSEAMLAIRCDRHKTIVSRSCPFFWEIP